MSSPTTPTSSLQLPKARRPLRPGEVYNQAAGVSRSNEDYTQLSAKTRHENSIEASAKPICTRYYAVYVPSVDQQSGLPADNQPDSPRPPNEGEPPATPTGDFARPANNKECVFESFADAAKFAKKYKKLDARFNSLPTFSAALTYVSTGVVVNATPRRGTADGKENNTMRTPSHSASPYMRRQLIESPMSPRSTTSSPLFASPNASLDGEPSCPYASVSARDMNALKRAIEDATQFDEFVRLIDENPRYLVNTSSGGHMPSIVFVGARYNALHIACRVGNLAVIRRVLSLCSSPQYISLLYPTDPPEKVTETCVRLIDYYVNTPDKSAGRTPLWFAVDQAHTKCVRRMCDERSLNLEAVDNRKRTALALAEQSLLPADCRDEDDNLLVGEAANAHRAKRARQLQIIQLLNTKMGRVYFVPIYRSVNNPTSGASIVGQIVNDIDRSAVISPSTTSLIDVSPAVRITYALCAYIGPCSSLDTLTALRSELTCNRGRLQRTPSDRPSRWSTMKCTDSRTGVQRVALQLAHHHHLPYTQCWPQFGRNVWLDFGTVDGLRVVETHLRGARDHAVDNDLVEVARKLRFDEEEESNEYLSDDGVSFYDTAETMGDVTLLTNKLEAMHLDTTDDAFVTAPVTPSEEATNLRLGDAPNDGRLSLLDRDVYLACQPHLHLIESSSATLPLTATWFRRLNRTIVN